LNALEEGLAGARCPCICLPGIGSGCSARAGKTDGAIKPDAHEVVSVAKILLIEQSHFIRRTPVGAARS
jgi:hypothetical protein